MKKTFFAAAVVAAFTFSACSENTTENTEATVEHTDAAQAGATQTTNVVVETPDYSNVAESMKTQISQLLSQYMILKEALVASDPNAAKASANEVLEIARAMPVATLTGDEKAYAEEKREEVVSSATQIAEANDLEAQRENFELLSEAVFSMAKAFDAADQTLYYQHCPMAMNNQGAYWLSTNSEIRNPYFGEQMLKCGSTEEVYVD